MFALAFVGALSGCEHGFENTWHKPTTPPEAPREGVGVTHAPYAGKPKYLASAKPMLPTREPGEAEPNPCATRSASCDVKLRAQLATVDAQVLALDTPPSPTELETLRLSLAQLIPLLAAYPDMASERDELSALVDKYPGMTPPDQVAAKKRMIELSDLIRLQLSAAQ